jgi:GNAT superfamily N-acetyltransferase
MLIEIVGIDGSGKTTLNVAISFATQDEYPEAQAFYTVCGYGGAPIEKSDIVVLARLDETIIGIVRLCRSPGRLWLRGMQVLSEFRRTGVGTALLDTLNSAMQGQPTYCLPYAHLDRFYGRAGFAVCDADSMPADLAARLETQQREGLSVIGMYRPA